MMLNDSAAIARVLGREPRMLDMERVRQFTAVRRFLVTGAGGSIGLEACRQLASMGCGRLAGLDHSDHALIDLMSARLNGDVREILCDVRDRNRLSVAFEKSRPNVVIHAAALKHVHMGDRHPAESVLTNLIGVRNAFEAAVEGGAETFVFVSSDKAAAPTSIMGACKRLAELYLEGRRRELIAAGERMRVVSVRFGNVFGSQGSVAEVFCRQIAAGEPITVTHRDMSRFFMTIEEAVQLILLVACAQPKGEEGGGAYLLDMGQPVRILDIAHRMMAEAGVSLPIVTCGAREGEKIEEELYDEHEHVAHSGVPGVLRVRSEATVRPLSRDGIVELERVARTAGDEYVRLRVFSALAEQLGADVSVAG